MRLNNDVPKTTTELASSRFVRFGDGGMTDTSSVSTVMAFLAQKDLDDGFNVMFFDTRPGGLMYSTTAPGAAGERLNACYTGAGTATLFGFKQIWDTKSGRFSYEDCDLGTCFFSALPHVFSNVSVTGQPVYFETDTQGQLAPAEPATLLATTNPNAACPTSVSYVKYDVTTVDNPLFDVKKGERGTLHVVVSKLHQPVTGPATYQCYQPGVDWIHAQVLAKGTPLTPTIGDYFQTALGLD
jgi:hypothetical protein